MILTLVMHVFRMRSITIRPPPLPLQQHVLRLFSRKQHGRPDSDQPSDVSEGENDLVAVDGGVVSCFLGVANGPGLYPPPPSAARERPERPGRGNRLKPEIARQWGRTQI